ncbi:MAG TPA: DNA repair protein RecN [bacterium]|nr:DNA repair protein RecN [bacterium]
MLKKLTIRDYALIEFIEVEFNRGLHILTGETGAGKSIIVGALGILLGDRASTEMIRSGTDKSIVEGIFHLSSPISLPNTVFEEDGIFHELILRREINRQGRTRCFINDTPVSLNELSIVGDQLVDLHGQHDHQVLLKTDHHLDYLDNFGIPEETLRNMESGYRKHRQILESLQSLIEREKEMRQRQELLEFQVKELNAASLRVGEEEALQQEERILNHIEKLIETAQQIRIEMYEGEDCVSDRIAQAQTRLEDLVSVDPVFHNWAQQCETARLAVEDVVNGLESYTGGVEFDPERLQEIRDRLGLITRLKKKYGPTEEEVIQYQSKAQEELDRISHLDENIEKMTRELEDSTHLLTEQTLSLSTLRTEIARELECRVMEVLDQLGLKNGIFKIKLTRKESVDGLPVDDRKIAVNSRGIDHAEFMISLNPGEEPKSLAKVASGGEISRIMLALKTVLARADRIPVMIFDEIDSGISGRIAHVVGKRLKEAAFERQVICITHLPQIASMGDHHYSVIKEVKDRRSITTLTILDGEQRVHEIAKLMGGDTITDSTLKSARELLEN